MKRQLAAIAVFAFFVVLFEGNGYIIHKLHYDMGAGWTPLILAFDNMLKLMMYQTVACLTAYAARSWRLLLVFEAFVLSSGQDLIFYGLWMTGHFPQGNWTWMGNYALFGEWSTLSQFLWTALLVTSAMLATQVDWNYLKLRLKL